MDAKRNGGPNRLELVNRQQLTLQGVLQVGSFDEKEITLETNRGLLVLKGERMRITELSLEEGNLAVEGMIRAMEFLEDDGKGLKNRGKGLLERLLK